MTMIKQHTSKGQLVSFKFGQDAIAAGQSDAQLAVFEVASGAALGVDEIEMPFRGEIVAISYDLSAAATAGSLTVGATINGTEDADTTVTITTGQRGYVRVPRGKAMFAAGAYLGLELTSSSGWSGTSADILATLWALVQLEGI